ncbi:MAG: ChrR family anti-sigma-E factor, partial [Alphaproteobacteria bacterium]|nr:ChrR family anti-sigma-E factor [Alphaproteobacteria bacterium]
GVHLENCAVCRARVADFEAVGGRLLEDTMPGYLAQRHLTPDALARTLERLDAATTLPRRGPVAAPRRAELGIALPASLLRCEIGAWRWLGPGFRWSKVTIPGNPEAKVVFLKGRAGLRLPAHGHSGTEFLQVLCGSLSDERGRYGPGDFEEADAAVDHQPVVDPQSECVCLAALEGDTRLHGLFGRLLWPLVGF